VKLNLDDYVLLMSTLSKPFHQYGEYEVEGNWWHSQEYFNLPLDEFYQTIKSAIQTGHTVRLNGDVTEPGLYWAEGVAIVPTFDIPAPFINQDSREFRFNNKTTNDDHDIHAVGFVRIGDFDWFLIKDSGAAAYRGPSKGYLFYREDYIRLKMLTCTVHKSVVKALVKDSRNPN
jgi:bleomycin hydrolase